MLYGLTFDDMENRFGQTLAFEYLREIEKSAGIKSPASFDPETRLREAYSTQDAALARRAA